jgi:hypothetical protein
VLTAIGTATSNPFLLELDGATGATGFALAYSDGAPSSGDAIAVNRYATGPNQIGVAGSFQGTIAFPSGTIGATNPGGDVFLLVGNVQ